MDGRNLRARTRKEQSTLVLRVRKNTLRCLRDADKVSLMLSSPHKIDVHRLELGNMGASARDEDKAEITVNAALTVKDPKKVRFTDGINEVTFIVERIGPAFTSRPMAEGPVLH